MKRNAQRIFVPSIIVLVILVLIAFFAWRVSKLTKVSKVEKTEKQAKTEISQISPAKPTLAHGKQVYEIITNKPRDPQIIEVTVDPLDVEFGETQTVTVKIKTKADSVKAEDFVLGTAICDQKEIEFPLKLKKVEGKGELITTWQGVWEREKGCTFDKNYQIKIFAKNIKGEDEVTISFGSSCPTPTDGQDYTLSTSTVGSEGCIFEWHINGVENGNIIIESGFTLTVGGGSVGEQTIVFNPGYSITIDGVIAISKEGPGQIRKAYICAKDSDPTPDGYYVYGVDTDSGCANFGGSRRYTIPKESLTDPDCDDSNGNIFQEVANLSKDGDRDGYLNPTPDTGVHCVGNSTTTDTRTYYMDANGNYSWLDDSQKFGTNDCDDSIAETTCYPDEDGDGYYSSTGKTCFSTYCPSSYSTSTGNDCDDSDSERWQNKTCYYDGDGDGYGTNSSATRCVGSSCSNSTDKYRADKSGDCCDSDSRAHPGQTSYYTAKNNCSSWDYNCSGAIEKSNCSGPGSYTLGVSRICYDNYLKCQNQIAEFTGYSSCSVSNVTYSCGQSWTSYSCSSVTCYYNPPSCYSATYYKLTSTSKTCACH